MIVVSDTSPITTLLKIGRTDLLQQLYGEVLIPEAVRAELSATHPSLPDYFQCRPVADRTAVMRLLARFTPLQIVDPRFNKFPALWETEQFAARKWCDVSKWHDARREAGKAFRKFFHFLPIDEKPLCWKRQAPGK